VRSPDGNERHTHPAGDGERGKRRSAGERELAYFCGGAGIQRQKERRSERGDREEERAHGGRSALAQSCEMVDCTLTAGRSQGNGDGFNDIAKNGISGFRFFLKRGVARAGDNAM